LSGDISFNLGYTVNKNPRTSPWKELRSRIGPLWYEPILYE